MAVPEKFRGAFPALLACYDERGEISRERSALLAKHYVDIGVKGLYVCGSSGESFYNSIEEREAVLEAVVEAVGKKLTLIAHISCPSTRDSIILAQHAEKLGVDAISAVPGIYYGLSDALVEKYWKDILAGTDKVPLIIYNIPCTTNGYNTSNDVYTHMLETGRLAGIKNTSSGVLDIHRFLTLGNDDQAIFNGLDEQYLAGRVMGASGGIGTTIGVMPELFLKMDKYIKENNLSAAINLQKHITSIIMHILNANGSLYSVCKKLLNLRGFDLGEARAPFLPVAESDNQYFEALYEEILAAIEND